MFPMGFLKKALAAALDALFPRTCFGCGRKNEYICAECLGTAPPAEYTGMRDALALFSYHTPAIKKALWTLKYRGGRELAALFARELQPFIAETVSEEALLRNFTKPLLIPIPLSKKRLRMRGFNHAALIARELARLSPDLELSEDALVKHKDTKPQATIANRTERLTNVRECFSVPHPESVTGRNIVLVDDITTTGGTLAEAKKVLRAAGARRVIAFTVAH